ncbi:MAG: HAMP domain-containing histidine kinase [Epsilonproteobacteria bacterium]|nr:HAMP domain-containing histidine kinase [Campylobacterota bacterium]
MKPVERESFTKGFALYFLSMSLSAGALFFMDYNRALESLKRRVESQMKICSYNLQCKDFQISFVPLKADALNLLEKDENGSLYSDFSIPQSKNFALRIKMPIERYTLQRSAIQKEYLLRFALTELLVALLSALFAWYALRPLRDALRLTEEFVKDILHDFNTPLSTIRLNTAILKRKVPDAVEVGRIEKAVQTILDLQNNLKEYLEKTARQANRLDLADLVSSRIEVMRGNFPDIKCHVDVPPTILHADAKALTRILDNLLSNAFRYNKPGGEVRLFFDPQSAILTIEDSGRGIQRPHKVFERFYKESSSGNGLGMHIVKKLCDALEIPITLESEPARGTTVRLDLGRLVIRGGRR